MARDDHRRDRLDRRGSGCRPGETDPAALPGRAAGAKFKPAERGLIDDLVNLADTVMYDAKHAGGNQSRSTDFAHADRKLSSA